MKVGDYVKTKNKPWHPLDSWTIDEIYGNKAYLVRYEGCGMSATTRNIDELELIDNYFSKWNKKQFDEKIESLIKEAIFKHKQYEEFHKSMYNTYLEYENPDTTRERRRELSKLMRSVDSYSDDYYSAIEKLSKMLNSHDFDIATRKINKEIINEADLWNDYFQWKSARSATVV